MKKANDNDFLTSSNWSLILDQNTTEETIIKSWIKLYVTSLDILESDKSNFFFNLRKMIIKKLDNFIL